MGGPRYLIKVISRVRFRLLVGGGSGGGGIPAGKGRSDLSKTSSEDRVFKLKNLCLLTKTEFPN